LANQFWSGPNPLENGKERNVISSTHEALLLLNKWKAEATPIYVVFVGSDKGVELSFFGLVEKMNFPCVQLRSLVSEMSANLEGASFRYSELRDAPGGPRTPLAKYAPALEAVFPDGGVCTFFEVQS
jgi:hypothetical protein